MVDEKVEHIVSIEIPDVVTLGMWETYREGQFSYIGDKERYDQSIARFYGAQALFKKGHVVVKGFQKLVDAFNAADPATIDGRLLGSIVAFIALPVENKVSDPFLDCLLELYPTGEIRVNGSVLRLSPDTSTPETITSSSAGESEISPPGTG